MWRCHENAVTPLSTGDAGRRSAFSPVLRLPQPPLQPQPAAGEPQALLSYKAASSSSETVQLVDEEEEDDIIEITSTFPLGQCSRTSPGNHATIRR